MLTKMAVRKAMEMTITAKMDTVETRTTRRTTMMLTMTTTRMTKTATTPMMMMMMMMMMMRVMMTRKTRKMEVVLKTKIRKMAVVLTKATLTIRVTKEGTKKGIGRRVVTLWTCLNLTQFHLLKDFLLSI